MSPVPTHDWWVWMDPWWWVDGPGIKLTHCFKRSLGPWNLQEGRRIVFVDMADMGGFQILGVSGVSRPSKLFCVIFRWKTCTYSSILNIPIFAKVLHSLMRAMLSTLPTPTPTFGRHRPAYIRMTYHQWSNSLFHMNINRQWLTVKQWLLGPFNKFPGTVLSTSNWQTDPIPAARWWFSKLQSDPNLWLSESINFDPLTHYLISSCFDCKKNHMFCTKSSYMFSLNISIICFSWHFRHPWNQVPSSHGSRIVPRATVPVEAAGPSKWPQLDFTAARTKGFSSVLATDGGEPNPTYLADLNNN